jgi:hypothetical protein
VIKMDFFIFLFVYCKDQHNHKAVLTKKVQRLAGYNRLGAIPFIFLNAAEK